MNGSDRGAAELTRQPQRWAAAAGPPSEGGGGLTTP